MVEKIQVTIFSGSKPRPGKAAYRDARFLGQPLAETGCAVKAGGYIAPEDRV